MANLPKLLLALAALAFVMAVVTAFTGRLLVQPESWSRAANNLALLAIGMAMIFKGDHQHG